MIGQGRSAPVEETTPAVETATALDGFVPPGAACHRSQWLTKNCLLLIIINRRTLGLNLMYPSILNFASFLECATSTIELRGVWFMLEDTCVSMAEDLSAGAVLTLVRNKEVSKTLFQWNEMKNQTWKTKILQCKRFIKEHCNECD